MGFGVMHGKIPLTSSATDAKNKIFKESDLFLSTELNAADSQHLQSLVLTEYHILLWQTIPFMELIDLITKLYSVSLFLENR